MKGGHSINWFVRVKARVFYIAAIAVHKREIGTGDRTENTVFHLCYVYGLRFASKPLSLYLCLCTLLSGVFFLTVWFGAPFFYKRGVGNAGVESGRFSFD